MVLEGHVRSLANHGGNTTGISIFASELDGKRLEILMELFPNARRIAILADSSLAFKLRRSFRRSRILGMLAALICQSIA